MNSMTLGFASSSLMRPGAQGVFLRRPIGRQLVPPSSTTTTARGQTWSFSSSSSALPVAELFHSHQLSTRPSSLSSISTIPISTAISPPATFLSSQNQQQQQQQQRAHHRRWFSGGWDGHGTDLLSDSLAHNYGTPKIILHGHSSSGFDVINMIKNKDPMDVELKKTGGIVHMNGSILAFPEACFLWSVRRPQELTVEAIVPPILLYRPALDYLFIGYTTTSTTRKKQALSSSAEDNNNNNSISPQVLDDIRRALKAENVHIVVEPMDITNAMGTFNILNGEDRRVGAALILPPDED
jgi:uncharacterized protein